MNFGKGEAFSLMQFLFAKEETLCVLSMLEALQ
jgi:hypothetical protein